MKNRTYIKSAYLSVFYTYYSFVMLMSEHMTPVIYIDPNGYSLKGWWDDAKSWFVNTVENVKNKIEDFGQTIENTFDKISDWWDAESDEIGVSLIVAYLWYNAAIPFTLATSATVGGIIAGVATGVVIVVVVAAIVYGVIKAIQYVTEDPPENTTGEMIQ